MSKRSFNYDSVVVGSGPNGLSAAIFLAQNKHSIILCEAKDTVGGGMRSAELTLPGFIHDICSAVHPLGIGSPFFRQLPLNRYGLDWVQPILPMAHPFDDGTAAILDQSIEKSSASLQIDSDSYKKLMVPLVRNWDLIENDILGPLHFPSHPLAMTSFGYKAIRSGVGFSKHYFQGMHARGFFAGLAAHSMMPLDWPLTAAFGIILALLGHRYGWPFARQGSQKIADALAAYFLSLGGVIETNRKIDHVSQLHNIPIALFDVTPKQLLHIAGNQFPQAYQTKLKKYRYGQGIYKMDWALSHPIPWKAKECREAGTIHIGGTLEEIALSESEVWQKKHPEKPFIILAQPSLFDKTRAPEGKHTAWGYCHVPSHSTFDMSERIEAQIERFAPGFRDCILARHCMSPIEMEQYNANYVGGDINGGVQDIFQLFSRPVARIVPYSTPAKGIYICSSSTPPGGGVHGMCGYHAAKAALRTVKLI